MRKIFIDNAYLVARSNQRDQWHKQSKNIELKLANVQLLTTELVLVEFLNYFSNFGNKTRKEVSGITQNLLHDSGIEIIWQTQELFKVGLELYQERLDKGYSLTDCVSMVVMRQNGIQEILTHDHHFTQEGFTILL
jgi:uncharacterized protein